jgi:hypothetical protein
MRQVNAAGSIVDSRLRPAAGTSLKTAPASAFAGHLIDRAKR